MFASLTVVAALFALPPIPDYAKAAHRLASTEVRDAIDDAYQSVDPRGLRPWWRAELYMICARESRCGREGLLGAHGNDARGTDRRAWERATKSGDLRPDECPEHAWQDGVWGTRGLFGMFAAYHVGKVGECEGPESMDDPEVGAMLAARWMAQCRRKIGEQRIACTCIDHTRMWIGAGVWEKRVLIEKPRDGRAPSRYVSVARQCGPELAAWMLVTELDLVVGSIGPW
jgi:hypothetical protein